MREYLYFRGTLDTDAIMPYSLSNLVTALEWFQKFNFETLHKVFIVPAMSGETEEDVLALARSIYSKIQFSGGPVIDLYLRETAADPRGSLNMKHLNLEKDEVEHKFLMRVLKQGQWSTIKAAQKAQISRKTIDRFRKKYGVTAEFLRMKRWELAIANVVKEQKKRTAEINNDADDKSNS